jgi:predicted acylesterase/phospholipase RssA
LDVAQSPRIGVVLSSGGIRGVYAHTGFLLGLKQMGIPVAAIAGCSAGAVVGAVFASGTPLDQWETSLSEVTPDRFWQSDSALRFFWNMAVRRGRGYSGLSGTDGALAFCRDNLAVQTFEECRMPFYALAINIGRGKKTFFSQGELAPRIVASAAMPVLYRPVEIDGELYCDGALIELAPMDAICCRHGLDALIIHHVSRRSGNEAGGAGILDKPWALVEILDRLLYRERPWYLSDEPIAFRKCPCGCGATVVVVEPRLPNLDWPVTDGGSEVSEAAKRQGESLLRPYKKDLLTDPRVKLGNPADQAN